MLGYLEIRIRLTNLIYVLRKINMQFELRLASNSSVQKSYRNEIFTLDGAESSWCQSWESTQGLFQAMIIYMAIVQLPRDVVGYCTRKREKNACVECFIVVIADLSRMICFYVGCVYPVVLRRVCVPCKFPDKPL